MTSTHSDWAAITNSATADAESAASAIQVNPGARITGISVMSLTVGNTYAVKIEFPGCPTPQKYMISSNAQVVTNGNKLNISQILDVSITIPANITSVNVTTFADTASATAKVSLIWEAPQ